MSLIRLHVQVSDNSGMGYASPTELSAINSDHISTAIPCESRGEGPWMRITLVDGQKLIARGTPDDLFKKAV